MDLEKTIALGKELGLKDAELREWVKSEQARLREERLAEREAMKAEREAERQALEKAHKQKLAELDQELVFLENLLKRREAEAASVTGTNACPNDVGGHGRRTGQLQLPIKDLAGSASHGTFPDEFQQDKSILPNESHLGIEKLSVELRSTIGNQKFEDTLHEKGPVPVDCSVSPEIKVTEASAKEEAITQADTEKTEACRSECLQLQCTPKQWEPGYCVELRKIRKLKRKPKKKKTSPLTKGSSNVKSCEVKKSHKLLGKRASLRHFLDGRLLKRKARMPKPRKTCRVVLKEHPVPRQPRANRLQVRSFGDIGNQLLSYQKKPDLEGPETCTHRHRCCHAQTCTPGAHGIKKTDCFRMSSRRLKLPGQRCWKYRRKQVGKNPLAANGTTTARTTDS